MEAEERLDNDVALPPQSSPSLLNKTTPSNETPPPPSQESLYHTISTYPFTTDPEYQTGLSSILGHPSTPATQIELEEKKDLVLRTQCFYLARKLKLPKVDPKAYKIWLESQSQQSESSSTTEETTTTPSNTPSTSTTVTTTNTTNTPPTYPTSFAAIVELITNNKPIPGIEEIPTTILEPGSSKQDHAVRRRKPWEQEKGRDDDISTDTTIMTTTTVGGKDGGGAEVEDGTEGGRRGEEESLVEGVDVRGRPLMLDADVSDVQNDDVVVPVPSDVTPSTTADFIPVPVPTSMGYNKGRRKDVQGVVKLLQPDAVPDSGLVAKD